MHMVPAAVSRVYHKLQLPSAQIDPEGRGRDPAALLCAELTLYMAKTKTYVTSSINWTQIPQMKQIGFARSKLNMHPHLVTNFSCLVGLAIRSPSPSEPGPFI